MEMWQWLVIGLCAFVVLQGALLWGMLRQVGVLHARIDALQSIMRTLGKTDAGDPLPIGSSAPAWQLPLIAGGALSSQDLRGVVTLLAFVHPGCKPCGKLLPHLDALGRRLDPNFVRLVFVSVADGADSAAMAQAFAVAAPFAFDADGDMATSFRVEVTPFVMIVDAAGIVRAGKTTHSIPQIESMLVAALDGDTQAVALASPTIVGPVRIS